MVNMLIVAATGGLGAFLVKEALERGHTVSILARDSAKIQSVLKDSLSKISNVYIGDASDSDTLGKASFNTDVIISGK